MGTGLEGACNVEDEGDFPRAMREFLEAELGRLVIRGRLVVVEEAGQGQFVVNNSDQAAMVTSLWSNSRAVDVATLAGSAKRTLEACPVGSGDSASVRGIGVAARRLPSRMRSTVSLTT